jgi:pimeloyl-ACP methyl ester carboxylesterase
MVAELDIETSDGRTLHACDSCGGELTVMWHHGTPNIGAPPEPLFAVADRLGVRFVSYDRPGYGGSTPRPGRVLGHSGGGSYALACAALLPNRVRAAVSISGLAPFTADGLDWFAGMVPGSEASLRAAAAGRAAKEAHAAAKSEPDFLPADWAALDGEWGWSAASSALPRRAGRPR